MESSTLVITGAGMSAHLGLPTTQKINDIIAILLDYDHEKDPRKISERLKDVAIAWPYFDDQAKNDFEVTLSLLFDGDGARQIEDAYNSEEEAADKYIKEFKKYLPKANTSVLNHHLAYLTQTYDLVSLKSIIYSLKRFSVDKIDIVDVLTAIQSSITNNISIPTSEIFPDESKDTRATYYCDRKRLIGALNAYKLLVYKIFKHSLRNMKNSELGSYERFCYEIAKNNSSLERLSINNALYRENYLSDIGYLTYNWDPVLPFSAMKVNQKLNSELLMASGNNVCKKVYVDFGVPFAGIALSGDHVGTPVYSFSEDAAFLINAFTKDSYTKYPDVKSKLLVKVIKLFVPHGLLNIRICPRCQNGFLIFPENIGELQFKDIANLFTSDPIPSGYDLQFICNGKYVPILRKYLNGLPDEIDCPSCAHPVYFEHSFLEIQSILKNEKPATINKIQFDYGDFFSRANHIVSIGYSFPKDDIINSVFLKNMKIRQDDLGGDCKLTYVGSPNPLYPGNAWYGYNQLGNPVKDEMLKSTINVVKSIFKEENMRFNFSGFPDILRQMNVKNILNWQL